MSALHVCLLKESKVAPLFAMFIALMTFSIVGWVRISIVEAGAITSILPSSWPGADHEILCCNLLSILLSHPPPSHVCWAQSQLARGSAAELHLAVIIIMIEREGGPRYCFD
jgi:hypothetical protein